MDELDPEKIKELFWASPQEVQDFLQSEHLLETLRELADAHHLHIDQLQNLSEEVVAVGIGARPPSSFTEKITRNLEISSKEAAEITKEIDDKVFKVIKQNLVMGHRQENEEEDHSKLSREDILKEIETHVSLPLKPTPIINITPDHTLVSPLATKELEAPKPSTPKPVLNIQNNTPVATPTPQPIQVPPQKTTPTIPPSLPIATKPEEKTKEVSVAPQSKTEITVPKKPPRSENRSTDPYREPIG